MPSFPYRVRIRWRVDCLSGADRPVDAPRSTHYTPAPGFGTWSLSLAVASVGTHRSRLLRAIGLCSATSKQNRKGEGAIPPQP